MCSLVVAFWCLVETMRDAGSWVVEPYHVNVPSFGEWGFALATPGGFRVPQQIDFPTAFLNPPSLAAMFTLPKDLAAVPVEINRADRPVVLDYYNQGWRSYH